MKQKLKLYGTLGPADNTREILQEMLRLGMTGIRLNLSHSNLEHCEEWIHHLHSAAQATHIIPDLLIDLQGPEVRIGVLDSPLTLEKGECIPLTASSLPEKKFRFRPKFSNTFLSGRSSDWTMETLCCEQSRLIRTTSVPSPGC
ncbi:MAG: pyruvate kinase [Eubacteriales bacterium]|nr:pyruvate kinase [Eubacteriales bacterium]